MLDLPGENRAFMPRESCHDTRKAKLRRLQDVYRLSGFLPLAKVRNLFGDTPGGGHLPAAPPKKRSAGLVVRSVVAATTGVSTSGSGGDASPVPGAAP